MCGVLIINEWEGEADTCSLSCTINDVEEKRHPWVFGEL